MQLGMQRRQWILQKLAETMGPDIFEDFNTQAQKLFDEIIEKRIELKRELDAKAPYFSQFTDNTFYSYGGHYVKKENQPNQSRFTPESISDCELLSSLNDTRTRPAPRLNISVLHPQVLARYGTRFDKPIDLVEDPENVDLSMMHRILSQHITGYATSRFIIYPFKQDTVEIKERAGLPHQFKTGLVYDPTGELKQKIADLKVTLEQNQREYCKMLLQVHNFLVAATTLDQVIEAWPSLKLVIPQEWFQEAQDRKQKAEEKRKQKLINEQLAEARKEVAGERQELGAGLDKELGRQLYAKRLVGEI